MRLVLGNLTMHGPGNVGSKHTSAGLEQPVILDKNRCAMSDRRERSADQMQPDTAGPSALPGLAAVCLTQ